MFSGWIGDNDPTFKGMEDALRKYLQSAWAGISIQDANFFQLPATKWDGDRLQ